MQPTEHVIQSGQVELFFRAYGDPAAPVLLALHGWPETGLGWHAVAPVVAEHRYVIVPDMRGFGRSGAPLGTEAYRMRTVIEDLVSMARWADVERFDLAGHDFGAAVTWATCTFSPQLVRRAVAMAAPHPMRMHSVAGNLGQIARSAYTFLLNLGPEGEALLSADDFGMLERFAFGANQSVDPDVRATYKKYWSEPGRFTAMAEWYRAHYRPGLLNPDIPLELPPTSVPIRYVHGTNDFAFVEELSETNAPFVAGDYDHVLLESSHWMLHERPTEMADLIIDWILRPD